MTPEAPIRTRHSVAAPEGMARFEARAALGLFALLIGAGPVLARTLLLRRTWAPLQELDDAVAVRLNALVAGSPEVVEVLQGITDLGGNGAAVYVFALATAALLLRGQRRLAAYVLTTGIGLAILVPVTKAVIGRPRPQVPLPVVDIPSNASFPSGHAMVSVVMWTILALVLMPAVRRRARPWLLAGALLVAVAVGMTRLALGVHFVSDVLAGWALGVGWLAVTTAAFRGWQHDTGRRALPLALGLDVEATSPPAATGRAEPVLPRGRATVTSLGAVFLVIFAGMSAIGLLVTGPLLDTVLGRFDIAVVSAFLDLRTETRTDLAKAVGTLSGTRAVIAIALAELVIIQALTRSWRPAVFVFTAVAGEVLLYFLTTQVVGRSRPDVRDLTSGLPIGASWPSGHSAAAFAIYGALAALVIIYGRSRWRWAILVVPAVLPPLIGLSRIYVAAHHPTDVVAGLLVGSLWVLACTRLLLLEGEEPPLPRQHQIRRQSSGGPKSGAKNRHGTSRYPVPRTVKT